VATVTHIACATESLLSQIEPVLRAVEEELTPAEIKRALERVLTAMADDSQWPELHSRVRQVLSIPDASELEVLRQGIILHKERILFGVRLFGFRDWFTRHARSARAHLKNMEPKNKLRVEPLESDVTPSRAGRVAAETAGDADDEQVQANRATLGSFLALGTAGATVCYGDTGVSEEEKEYWCTAFYVAVGVAGALIIAALVAFLISL
jgi:hypothetical protein